MGLCRLDQVIGLLSEMPLGVLSRDERGFDSCESLLTESAVLDCYLPAQRPRDERVACHLSGPPPFAPEPPNPVEGAGVAITIPDSLVRPSPRQTSVKYS